MALVLEIVDAVAGYSPGRPVLRGVDLTVPAKQTIVVMGHNGAGKTTLVRTIFGLVPLTQGKLLFKGRALTGGPSERVRRGISYSAAGDAVLPGLTVSENLAIAADVPGAGHAEKDARRETVFGIFPVLPRRGGQRAGTLSGGERRMLSVGMALMQGPEVLLLDEPSLGLSPVLVGKLYEAIAESRRDLGLTVVLVEQSINPALLQADHLYILRMGQIAFSGAGDVLQDTKRLWSLL